MFTARYGLNLSIYLKFDLFFERFVIKKIESVTLPLRLRLIYRPLRIL